MANPLEARLAALLDKRRDQSKLRVLKTSPPGSIDFSSNDFLSLATNSAFRKDYLEALASTTNCVGSTGSRLLDGNSKYAETLEREIAEFHDADAALLTNSGFDANVSIFTCLPQPGDIILYDELIHASVHDGMRASRAEHLIMFNHNDVAHLSQLLKALDATTTKKNIFVAVESVYSMEGDLGSLAEICDLLDRVVAAGRAHLIVDEAHATGVYGPHGAGLVQQLGLQKRVSVRLHTFGKGLACNGAAVLCSPTIRQYLINYARPLIFTTFMSYPSLVAIRNAYSWMKQGKTEVLVENLWQLVQYLHQQLLGLRRDVASLADAGMLVLPESCPKSPIVALFSNTPRDLAGYCQAAGFVIRPVVPPTVPDNTERVRVCLHGGNTTEQIDAFVLCLRRWILSVSASTNSSSQGPSAGDLILQAKL
jgi:8-amino-7-oxononanoate synthase